MPCHNFSVGIEKNVSTAKSKTHKRQLWRVSFHEVKTSNVTAVKWSRQPCGGGNPSTLWLVVMLHFIHWSFSVWTFQQISMEKLVNFCSNICIYMRLNSLLLTSLNLPFLKSISTFLCYFFLLHDITSNKDFTRIIVLVHVITLYMLPVFTTIWLPFLKVFTVSYFSNFFCYISATLDRFLI